MERREFLRQTAAGAVGLMLSDAEKDVVDDRLTQKVTLAVKGMALSDLCDQLRVETGVHLTAGQSVADEKVTIFCKGMPLRDVMRQLSRPFGYAWSRSMLDARRSMLDAQRTTPNRSESSIEHRASSIAHRYELMQDLRSQLLEEELRNRDRHAALLALERDIERYRPYLDLLPDEALARAATAPPAEQALLKRLGGLAWGPLQMYARLSPQEMEALRAGKELKFSTSPSWRGERPLPPELRLGVLQSQRHARLIPETNMLIGDLTDPRGVPLTAVAHAHAMVRLTLDQSELGQFALGGGPGVYCADPVQYTFSADGLYAVGRSPSTLHPNNAAANARLARDRALRSPVSVAPSAKRSATNDPQPRTNAASPPPSTLHPPPSTLRKSHLRGRTGSAAPGDGHAHCRRLLHAPLRAARRRGARPAAL